MTAGRVLALDGPHSAPVVAPPDTPRPQWLTARRQGLGASDAAAALGLDPWRSPYQLWLDKTGRSDDADDHMSEAARHGLALEHYVAGLWQEQHPDLTLSGPPGLLRHPNHAWMLATPDRLTTVDAQVHVVELKTVGLRSAGGWTGDEAPARYLLQVQHQIAVTEAGGGWLAALIGGQRYTERRIPRDDQLIDQLIDRLGAWWERHVVADVPPPMDGRASTTRALTRLHRTVNPGAVVDLPAGRTRRLLRTVRAARAAEDAAAERRRRAENTLRDMLGSAEVGLIDGQSAVTCRPNGTLRAADLARDRPDLAAAYQRPRPALDTAALARDHPDIYRVHRARVLRITHPEE